MSTALALLDHAEDLSRRRGFDGFSFGDLAERLGIRKASIHYHFPTKARMAEAVVERYTTRFLAELSALDGPPATRLREYVNLYAQASGDGSKLCLCVAYGAEPANLPDGALATLQSFQTASLEWLTEIFSSLGWPQPQDEAAALLALVEGAQIAARRSGSLDDFHRATGPFLNRLPQEA